MSWFPVGGFYDNRNLLIYTTHGYVYTYVVGNYYMTVSKGVPVWPSATHAVARGCPFCIFDSSSRLLFWAAVGFHPCCQLSIQVSIRLPKKKEEERKKKKRKKELDISCDRLMTDSNLNHLPL
jgi:hypothetical protein